MAVDGSRELVLVERNPIWTSRGFPVADVDYGGSSGYGREYRERLHMQWGVVDVQDCTNAAKYLAEKNLADPARVAITGGSAGGLPRSAL